MNELLPLAKELREQLGAPPEPWLRAQRFRLRRVLNEPPPRRASRSLVLSTAALLVAGGLVWALVLRPHSARNESTLVEQELSEPYRFGDGSSIALRPGGRGRLTQSNEAVHFDLHQGLAFFDVVPKQPRQWTITAGRNEVRIVGTRFSVLYGPEETFEVRVERGIVSVRVPDRSAPIQLRAGDRLEGRPGRIALQHGSAPRTAAADTGATPTASEPATASSTPPAETAARLPPNNDWQVLYRQGSYAKALSAARGAGVEKLIAELSSKGLADLADTARLGGDPALAVRVLNALLRRFPSSAEAREGKFLLGRVHVLRGDTRAAITHFEDYLRQSQAIPYASEATGRLMELYSTQGNHERARVMAERYLERAPDGPYRNLALSIVARHD